MALTEEQRKEIAHLTWEEKMELLDKFIAETEPVAWKDENGNWVVKEGEEWMYEPY